MITTRVKYEVKHSKYVIPDALITTKKLNFRRRHKFQEMSDLVLFYSYPTVVFLTAFDFEAFMIKS